MIEASGFALEKLLEGQARTTVWPRSEFCPEEQLRIVLTDHPAIDYLAEVFAHGMEYTYYEELSEAERKEEQEEMVLRGNHKLATKEEETVGKLLAREVLHGFNLPFKACLVNGLKGALVQPCGLGTQYALQWTEVEN